MITNKLYPAARALLLALAIGLAGCASQQAQGVPTATPSSSGAPRVSVTPTPAKASVSTSGEIATLVASLSVGFEQSGKVTAINVRPGQALKKGDILATVDDTTLIDAVTDAQLSLDLTEANQLAQNVAAIREAIAAAEAALNAAYASYNTTKVGTAATDIETARQNADSAWASYLSVQLTRDRACGAKDGLEASGCKSQEVAYGNAFESQMTARAIYAKAQQPVSQTPLLQAGASVASSKAKLDDLKAGPTDTELKTAELQRSQTRASLERARANMSKATLVSPCDCVVQDVNVTVGAMPAGAAFTLADVSTPQFKTTNLVEGDVASMQVGATASIRLKAYNDPFTGKVSAVLAQSAGTQSGSALYTVLIKLDPTTLKLLPGMTGQADITTR